MPWFELLIISAILKKIRDISFGRRVMRRERAGENETRSTNSRVRDSNLSSVVVGAPIRVLVEWGLVDA